ncbi:MAG: O-methyltransferase [Micrococcaceae bacterium]
MEEKWEAVDDFLAGQLVTEPKSCIWVREVAEKADMPPIEVTSLQGKFLAMQCQLIKAKRVLELGTLAGYSTSWFATAVPENGVVHTIESRESHVKVAKKSFSHPDLKDKVILHHGRAAEVMHQLLEKAEPAFDFIFVDADKQSYPEYLELALKLSHENSTIIIDNTIRQGAILADVPERKVSIHGLKNLYKQIKSHPELDVTVLQTVGAKGWDGFMMIRRKL